MCFESYDADWCASISETEDLPYGPPGRCCDCGSRIHDFQPRRTIYQQENKCPVCDGACKDHNHDVGETFSAIMCVDCVKARDAIASYETAQGCPKSSSQPPYGALTEAFYEHEQRWEYAEACVSASPELFEHPFIVEMLSASDE